jgi:uncharacterized protein
LPFLQTGMIERDRMPALLTLTLVGSLLGALVFAIPQDMLPLIIAGAMLVVAAVVLRSPPHTLDNPRVSSKGASSLIGYSFTLLLGVFGGL